MGRTRVRGIDLGGTKVAIEVPGHLDWRWPDTSYDAFAVAPHGAEVHVGVRVGAPPALSRGGFLYETDSHRFEVVECPGGWGVTVHGASGRERVAIFDEGFSNGEVTLTPSAAAAGIAPLAHPLDELVALHRVVRAGGIVVRGRVAERAGRAIVFLGAPASVPSGEPGWRSAGLQRLAGDRIVVRPIGGEVRAIAAPWNGDGLATGSRPVVEALHVVHPSHAVVAERPDRDAAITDLLAHAVAPIHDDRCADRLFDVAAELVERIPVLRVGLPEERRTLGLGWVRGAFGERAPASVAR